MFQVLKKRKLFLSNFCITTKFLPELSGFVEKQVFVFHTFILSTLYHTYSFFVDLITMCYYLLFVSVCCFFKKQNCVIPTQL